jgi:hypothetical protein
MLSVRAGSRVAAGAPVWLSIPTRGSLAEDGTDAGVHARSIPVAGSVS